MCVAGASGPRVASQLRMFYAIAWPRMMPISNHVPNLFILAEFVAADAALEFVEFEHERSRRRFINPFKVDVRNAVEVIADLALGVMEKAIAPQKMRQPFVFASAAHARPKSLRSSKRSRTVIGPRSRNFNFGPRQLFLLPLKGGPFFSQRLIA